MVKDNDKTDGKRVNEGLESKPLDGSETLLKPRYNLKKMTMRLKKEQDNNTKMQEKIREDHTDRIIGEMIKDTVENLNWEYDRPGRGWITTSAVIIGVEYIYQDFDIDGIESKIIDIMKGKNYYAKKEIKSRYVSHGSYPIHLYLDDKERGRISKIGEIIGYDGPKVKGLLFSLGVVSEDVLSLREQAAYNLDIEDLIGQLPLRMAHIETTWQKMIKGGNVT